MKSVTAHHTYGSRECHERKQLVNSASLTKDGDKTESASVPVSNIQDP